MQPALRSQLNELMQLGKQLGMLEPQSKSEAGTTGKYLTMRGARVLDCTRMDYLGLGEDPRVREMMTDAIHRYDISCPASQIVTQTAPTAALEDTVNAWTGLDKTLIFTTGYSVNVNFMQAIGLRFSSPHLLMHRRRLGIGRADRKMKTVFFMEKSSHYSLQHGARCAKSMYPDLCEKFTFDANDLSGFAELLHQQRELLAENQGLVVTDSLDSASGQRVDLHGIYELAAAHNCLTYMDEAHAVGAVGNAGRGLAAELVDRPDVDRERLIVMGTFTKAFSQLGGFVSLGSGDLGHLIRAASPQYVFSAPILPWMAVVVRQLVEMMCTGWGETRRASLQSKSDFLRNRLNDRGFDTLQSKHHIVPVLIGDEQEASFIQDRLRGRGFNVAAFTYPAVRMGRAVLRFSVCDDMTYEELDGFVRALDDVAQVDVRNSALADCA